MPLVLTHQHLPGISLIALDGEIDRSNSAELAHYLDQARRHGDHVVFDLTELSFIDSAGLHILLSCARRCATEATTMHLAGARRAPARLLQITGVARHLPTHNTVQEALTTILTLNAG
jgi:anti-sigma B factor antagonist